MLTVSTVSSSRQAFRYYTEAESDRPLYSEWQGIGAQFLGLEGEVDEKDFQQFLSGFTHSGEPLNQRSGHTQRTPAYDLTFSAPKSVSIEAIFNEDPTTLTAHRQSVRETLSRIEETAQIRIEKDGRRSFMNSANIISANFEHHLSRSNDPQLHTHCVVINTSRYKDKWRSLYARNIFTKIREWGAFYRSILADQIHRLGIAIRSTPDGLWELAKISNQDVQVFSQRRKQILEKSGHEATTYQKKYACLSTRLPKQTASMDSLIIEWERRRQQHYAAIQRSLGDRYR